MCADNAIFHTLAASSPQIEISDSTGGLTVLYKNGERAGSFNR